MGEKRNRYRFKNKGVSIEVFRTKSGHFRIRIDEEKDSIKYEVTLGGMMWYEGKGREFEDEIKERCKNILDDLICEYRGAFGEDYQVQDERISPCGNKR